MLRDYETMLKNQSSRLSELDTEREELHVHNTELEARVRDLEMRLGKVTSARDRLNERVEELTATLQGEGETIVTCRMEVHFSLCPADVGQRKGDIYQATTLQLMLCLPSLVPRPRPAFHCLQYRKAGEGLVYFLM